MMKQFFKMKNRIQTYAWGSHTSIGELLGTPTPTKQPQAELWMGDHPKAPSQIFRHDAWHPLPHILTRHAEEIIGPKAALRYGGRLPYLFKVLAAEEPLSIQAHPDKSQAEKGFDRENHLGIPLDAPHRNYRDNNHKPECLFALTPFWVLCGFRNIGEVVSLMSPLFPPEFDDLLAPLKEMDYPNPLERFFKRLITLDDGDKHGLIDHVLHQLQKKNNNGPEAQWVAKLHRYYPYDIGVLSPLFLNLVKLTAGEAIFLSAGVLHAYLHGTGIELMANSDNVLRGGLTPKHIDVEELMQVLKFESYGVDIRTPAPTAPLIKTLAGPVEEFELAIIELVEDEVFVSDTDRGVEILLCIEGQCRLTALETGFQLNLSRGESILIPHALHRYEMLGSGRFCRAGGPILI